MLSSVRQRVEEPLAARKPRRKVKKPERARPARSGPGPLRRLLGRIPPRPAVHAALALLLIAAAGLGLAHVRRHVSRLDQFQLRHLKLELPAWCTPEIESRLRAMPGDFAGSSIFDMEVCRRAQNVYRFEPWVRCVEAVRTEFPDTLVVQLDLRRPRFAIDRNSSYVLVDRDGYVVPARYQDWADAEPPVQVVWGVTSMPPPPGRRWRDNALQGGIETLAVIAARQSISSRLTITGADVSNYGGRRRRGESDIDVITQGGCRILWGRPPSTRTVGEVPLEAKLKHLEKVLDRTPDPRGIKINVRFADAGGGIITDDEGGAVH